MHLGRGTCRRNDMQEWTDDRRTAPSDIQWRELYHSRRVAQDWLSTGARLRGGGALAYSRTSFFSPPSSIGTYASRSPKWGVGLALRLRKRWRGTRGPPPVP